MNRNYFPPVNAAEQSSEQETSTDATELAAKLPSAPATEPKDPAEPSSKKQKTHTTTDDDFVVVDEQEVDEAKKAEPARKLD
jgi:hypothetical protein